MTPTQLVAELFAVDASPLFATRIKDGLTNDSYRVTGLELSVVVRISNIDSVSLRINRSSEAIVLKLVEQAGIGALVLVNQPDARILITREVVGRTLVMDEVGNDINITRIALLLQQLHSMTVPDTVQSMWLVATLQGYWQFLGQQENDRALSIARESDRQAVRCLCHNDVHHLNLIDDGSRLWLLDWEYAAVGDPYFDLASVCCYHEFDQAQRHALLDCYALTAVEETPALEVSSALPLRERDTVRGNDLLPLIDHARLERMCWLFDYIKELWFTARKVSGATQNQNSTILTSSDRSK